MISESAGNQEYSFILFALLNLTVYGTFFPHKPLCVLTGKRKTLILFHKPKLCLDAVQIYPEIIQPVLIIGIEEFKKRKLRARNNTRRVKILLE